MSVRSAVLLSVSALLLGIGGCSSTIHDSARIGRTDTLSIDAKQRLVLMRDMPDGRRVVCAEPSPDAIVAVSAALAAQGSASRAGREDVKAAFGAGSSESAASIAMRTATVQVLRDGYYRLCEGVMNGAIDQAEYEDVIKEIGPFITTVMAADAIGGAPQAPAIAISGGAAVASAGGAEIKQTPGGGLNVEMIDMTGTNKKTVKADYIAQILSRYLDHREAVYRLRARNAPYVVR